MSGMTSLRLVRSLSQALVLSSRLSPQILNKSIPLISSQNITTSKILCCAGFNVAALVVGDFKVALALDDFLAAAGLVEGLTFLPDERSKHEVC